MARQRQNKKNKISNRLFFLGGEGLFKMEPYCQYFWDHRILENTDAVEFKVSDRYQTIRLYTMLPNTKRRTKFTVQRRASGYTTYTPHGILQEYFSLTDPEITFAVCRSPRSKKTVRLPYVDPGQGLYVSIARSRAWCYSIVFKMDMTLVVYRQHILHDVYFRQICDRIELCLGRYGKNLTRYIRRHPRHFFNIVSVRITDGYTLRYPGIFLPCCESIVAADPASINFVRMWLCSKPPVVSIQP